MREECSKVLLVAAPKKINSIYMNVAGFANLDLIAIETESVAMGRAMYRAMKKKDCVTLDFGANIQICVLWQMEH
jgi:hypothetical protein